MDKQNLLPNFLSSSTYKLTKAASFSELSTTKKVVIEQQQYSKEYGNLIKQYSCEQIFDKKFNSSLVKVSCKLKSDNKEHTGTWNSTVSVVSSLANLVQGDDIKVPLSIERQYSSSSSEYFDLKESNINFKKIDINNKNNFYDYEESINENCNKSKFEFKRPTLMIKKSRVLNGIDNVIHDNYNVNKNNLSALFQRNTSKNSNQNQKIDTSKLKEKLRSLVVRRPKKINDFNWFWFFIFILLISITSLYLIVLFNDENLSYEYCNPRFNFQNTSIDLKNHIHGQDTAINELIKYFEEKENKTGLNIIGLIGGTGVGKSYAAEIIKNNVKDTFNILDVFHPFKEKVNQAYASLSVCQCNLIKLENIKTDDIIDSINFINYLNKQTNDYCILILALYNTEVVDHNLKRTLNINKSLSEISENFQNKNLQFKMLSFTALGDDTLIRCIKDAADYNNMELTDKNIEYIKNDLLRADSGCKGAHAKIQIVGKAKNVDKF